jgi:rhamnosyltransferase
MVGTCSIVVRAFNEAEHIGRLMEGIRQQTVSEVQVVVVDSGSTDETASIARLHGAEIIRIPSVEFSFGRSLNLGVLAARHPRVVIASAHVYPVFPDWLECLLGPLDNPDVALVYGRQLGTENSKFSELQVFRQWFPEEESNPQASPFCNNANAAIRRSLWERHPYDESLTGLEDLAWAKWAQSQGFQIHYAAKAEVVHVHRETPRAVFQRYRREGMAFKRIFPEAHFSIYDFVRLAYSNIVEDIRAAVRTSSVSRDLTSIIWFRILQFWGTYQGYRNSGPVTQHLRQTFYYPRGAAQSDDRDRPHPPIRYE